METIQTVHSQLLSNIVETVFRLLKVDILNF